MLPTKFNQISAKSEEAVQCNVAESVSWFAT